MKGIAFFPACVCADLSLLSVLCEICMNEIQTWQAGECFVDPDKS